MSVIHYTGATFVKKKSWLVAAIVMFDTAGLHLRIFRILESCPSKDTVLGLISVKLQLNCT